MTESTHCSDSLGSIAVTPLDRAESIEKEASKIELASLVLIKSLIVLPESILLSYIERMEGMESIRKRQIWNKQNRTSVMPTGKKLQQFGCAARFAQIISF